MMKRLRARSSAIVVLAGCLVASVGIPGVVGGSTAKAAGAAAGACTSTQRINLSSSGAPVTGLYLVPAISGDGRYVAFASSDSRVVPGDTNGTYDVFLRDTLTNATERVSVSSTGAGGDDMSIAPAVSGDGSYVAFTSNASNLVPGDTNQRQDVFVRDRVTGQTERVSVSSTGGQGDAYSTSPTLSADGRYVAFTSKASNLVPGDTNQREDVFVHDRLTGQTERVSVSSAGDQGNDGSGDPAISADGRYVAFDSTSSNLVAGEVPGWERVYVHDLVTGQTELVSVSSAGAEPNDISSGPAISADGQYVAFTSGASNLVPGDTNQRQDVFIRDRTTDETERVSLSSGGAQSDADSGGETLAVSADGRYVAFTSWASNLVPGSTVGGIEVFVRDRVAGRTEEASVSASGIPAQGASEYPVMSANARYVGFVSNAANLVPLDTNDDYDVFVHDRNADLSNCATTPATAVLDWRNEPTGSDHGFGYATVRVEGNRVCFGLRWNRLTTPTGADIDPASAVGTVAVRLFASAPGPNATDRTAWGCVTTDAGTAADLAAHPEKYFVNIRTAQFPAGAIGGLLVR